MRKLLALILGILGLLLTFAGLGLITLATQFLLYLGAALLILALLFFIKS